MKFKNTRRTISYHINNDFRKYAIYTLQSRGIPAFDDSLTTVQRIILKNAKVNLEKTLSLLGSCMSDGYNHGDNSLAGAIAKITRDFNCSENLLEGKGFWGTPVVHEAAAPRYTSVKMKNDIKQEYLKYSYLDHKVDDTWQPLYMDIPIGLANMTTGIAVGYRSIILPRKLSDIKRFLDGNLKTVKPYFKNFKGKVLKHKESGGWIITGSYQVDEGTKTIHIDDVPHIIKYPSFMAKLIRALDASEINYTMLNDSAEKVDVKIKCNKVEELTRLTEIVDKNLKILVKESIVFIKDTSVITYKNIEDYLTDYKIRIKELEWKDNEYKFNVESFNLEYEKAKLKFLLFMTEKKRTRDEVTKFLKQFNNKISSKLDSIKLTKLNKETIEETKEEIKRLEKLVKDYTKKLKDSKKEYEKMFESFKFTGNITGADNSLFEDEEPQEYNGITVFQLNDNDEVDEVMDEEIETI